MSDKILIIGHPDATEALKAMYEADHDIEVVQIEETELQFTRLDEIGQARGLYVPAMPITIHELPRLTCFIPPKPSKRHKRLMQRQGARHY